MDCTETVQPLKYKACRETRGALKYRGLKQHKATKKEVSGLFVHPKKRALKKDFGSFGAPKKEAQLFGVFGVPKKDQLFLTFLTP